MDRSGWDARYAASPLVWGAEPNRFVVREFAELPPGRALDLAAGEGRNAIWLASLGWRVVAVDFSAVAIDRGRTLAATNGVTVDWVVADVAEYQPDTGAFDAVLIAYLHLPPTALADILARAVLALAPGGHLFVVGHDVTNLNEGTGGPQDPRLLYTPETIAAELSGLEIRQAERVRRPVTTDQGTVDAIDTVVCAIRP